MISLKFATLIAILSAVVAASASASPDDHRNLRVEESDIHFFSAAPELPTEATADTPDIHFFSTAP